MTTTVSGLSEGMMWDFKEKKPAEFLFDHYGFRHDIIADIVPTFAVQGKVSAEAAKELGIPEGTPVSYRGGDQPNNALSLNVLEPGEIAATGGTSGVVYGVLGEVNYDPKSRVNTFAHVNYTEDKTRLGVLLCINGTGILNAWMKRTVAPEGISYAEMNDLAESVPVGAEGLSVIPFGNGAERVLENRNPGASLPAWNKLQYPYKSTRNTCCTRGYCFLFRIWHGDNATDGYGHKDYQGWSCKSIPLTIVQTYFGGCHRSYNRIV